jgi:DNA uptake protein ComE-like DNA-binding protein
MKRFLAGLAVGVAAIIALKKSGTFQRQGAGGEEASRPTRQREPRAAAVAKEPQDRELAGRARVSARPAATASQEPASQPAAAKPARSAEEVLNSATRQQLLSVYGIGPVLADRIIQNRPYAAAYDVVEQGIIPESTFTQLRKQLLEQQSA